MTDLNALPFPELFRALTSDGLTRRLFEIAREEDLGPRGLEGDVASASFVRQGARSVVNLVPRGEGVVAGLEAVPLLLAVFGATVDWRPHRADGDRGAPGEPIAALAGESRVILALERTLLNTLGRCSGVATRAAAFVAAARSEGGKAKVCETRKTIPGLRALDKYSARCGGAFLHRLGLYDAALYKDNHLAGVPVRELAARVADAARLARRSAPEGLRFVEVEVDTLDQHDALLTLPPGVVDIILLDNMPLPALREAVARRDAKNPDVLLEASGGVTLSTIGAISATGVDRVSVGAITHAAPSLDIGLDAA